MLVLRLQRVSSRVSGFPAASPCLWGKLQNLSLSKVSKKVVMWFCVVGVVLPDILTCLQTRRQSFCVAGAMLLRRFQTISCISRSRGSASETSIVILRRRRNALDVSCYVLLRIAMSRLRQVVTLHTFPFTLSTLHSALCIHTPHFTLYTPNYTIYTPHSTPYTLHSTLYTSRFTLYTPHSTLYTPHFPLHTPHFTLHMSHLTLHTSHSTFDTPHSQLHTLRSKLYT